jgi:hypothetical protein
MYPYRNIKRRNGMRRRLILKSGAGRGDAEESTSSLFRRVGHAECTSAPVFACYLQAWRKILSRFRLSAARGEITKIADLLGVLPMTAPLIAQIPPVHVNFARENPSQSTNYHDHAAT